MTWDLGLTGVATLLAMALLFGAFTQLLFLDRALWWVGIVAAAVAFVVGLFVSEVVFGWATAEELQPNIDGLSFDEVLITYLLGIPIVLAIRYATRQRVHTIHAHG
ncbi:MAG TPA: hypothetical protein VFY23_02600 [Candidatus Limnocylindrales bacterium]|nr:hypothetical protein [Candidatus Limnocylindrales bacterium]